VWASVYKKPPIAPAMMFLALEMIAVKLSCSAASASHSSSLALLATSISDNFSSIKSLKSSRSAFSFIFLSLNGTISAKRSSNS